MSIRNRQKGAATLLVAIVLLISITLVVLLTAKTVLIETKVEANNYRAGQSVAAAAAGLDYGISYFDNGTFDHDSNDVMDFYLDAGNDIYRHNLTLTSSLSSQVITANVYFDNDDSDNPAGSAMCTSTAGMQSGLVIASGFSDDGIASRTVSQCLGIIPIFKDNGPDQPLISKGAVGMTGNASVINRYSNITIWSGDETDIGNSVSMSTYLWDEVSSPLTSAQLIDTDPSNNAQKISSSRLGNGFDIIDSDPGLSSLTGEQFFNNFFSISRDGMESIAQNTGQHYASGNVSSDLDGQSNIIWVDGDATINSNITVGSVTEPAIVYINGNLNYSGGPTIYGILYVVGQMTVTGTVSVIGSSIVEGDPLHVPAGEDPVDGNGTLNLVYAPDLFDSTTSVPDGISVIVDGSWRDW